MNITTNNTADSLYLSILRAQEAQAEDVKYKMAGHFWPVIGTANQMAFVAIDDAVVKMKERGMFIHREKWHAQEALKEYRKYEHAAYEHYREMGDDRYHLWQDMICRGAEKLQPDYTRLYFAVKNVLDREKVRNSDVLASIQAALALITLSTLMYDTMEDMYQRKTIVNIRGWFSGGRLTTVERHWIAVGEITGRKYMKEVDLRNDELCQRGINVILTRYQATDFLNDAAGEALGLNPELMEKYCNDIK